MARKSTKNQVKPTQSWVVWSHRIAKAEKDYGNFCRAGSTVMDRYRLEQNRTDSANSKFYKDKYNILYSSTETIRPSLYAQTPKPQVNPRHTDNTDDKINLASMVLENCLQYGIQDIDMDGVMENVVSDYLLPGLGMAWVRYDFKTSEIDLNEDVPDAEPDMYEYTEWERLGLDYVHFKDILFSGGRTWEDIWWIAKRSYMFKDEATKRFGDKAASLDYSHQQEEATSTSGKNVSEADSEQAMIWEIWDKRKKRVVWWSEGAKDVLDEKEDPLRLKDFFPCPKPLRAVTTTDTFTPKSYFVQYKQQAETLDDLTMRIRILSDALRLVGVYDQSQDSLQRLLTGTANKMVAVENWAQFSSQGGMQGSVQFLPIQEVATVLTELYKQREIAKNEIYEITGFSDIVRGVSKASETLGAQELKNQWAGSRLKMLQKEVQRFCRDIIRIMAEVIAEHFDEDTLKQYSGFQPPEVTPEEQQAQTQAMLAAFSGQQVSPSPTQRQLVENQFTEVVEMLRQDKIRCAIVDIETDSTIMPDEAAERKDRMDFLGAMGAFLQQAGPMVMQYPEMKGLLGAMLMFTARTFRASRPIEKAFEDFQKQLQMQPPQDPNTKEGEGGDNGQAALQTAQIKAQADQQSTQAKVQADQQTAQLEAQVKVQEADKRYQVDMAKIQAESQYKQRELAVREREVAVKEAELGLKREAEAHDQEMDQIKADQADEALDNAGRAQDASERQESKKQD